MRKWILQMEAADNGRHTWFGPGWSIVDPCAQWFDDNGVVRVTIKQGAPRPPRAGQWASSC
jgi:hypothetical protein